LKEDALVLVTDNDGSLPLAAQSPLGLYYHDTQYLSGYALRVNGSAPILLSANTEQNYVATFQLMHSEGATPSPSDGPDSSRTASASASAS
jgi:hypothetical protein